MTAPHNSQPVTDEQRHAQALAEGYKDETCSVCGTLFLAHIHFIRCDATPCPMRSTIEPRTLLEQLASQLPSTEPR